MKPAALDAALEESFSCLDANALEARFQEQNGLIILEDLLPTSILDELIARYDAELASRIHRSYVPGQKKGGSVSRHVLDRHAPAFAVLYGSPVLRRFVEVITGERLLACPRRDPHAYALYCYTEPGDHIGWHFDTSFYEGKRYTILFGLVENASCRLECELYTRVPGRPSQARSIVVAPGTMVLFDGDQLWHRVSPMARDDGPRVILAMELLTDTVMPPFRRLISDVKDAVAYFGFREVFLGPRSGAPGA